MTSCKHPDAIVVYPVNDVCPLCVAQSKLDRLARLEVEMDSLTHDLEVIRHRELVAP